MFKHNSSIRWNLNLHYHKLLLGCIPENAKTALDVGCGEGQLTFDLADLGLTSTGIDLDLPCIESARTKSTERTSFIVGDFLEYPLEPGSYDCVLSVATLHHVELLAGIRRLKSLVSPDGTLAVISFARPVTLSDYLLAVAGRVLKLYRRLTGQYWEHNAPTVWPPTASSLEVEELLVLELPGAKFIRLMSCRYAIIWRCGGVDD